MTLRYDKRIESDPQAGIEPQWLSICAKEGAELDLGVAKNACLQDKIVEGPRRIAGGGAAKTLVQHGAVVPLNHSLFCLLRGNRYQLIRGDKDAQQMTEV